MSHLRGGRSFPVSLYRERGRSRVSGWSRDGAQLDKDAVLLVRYPSREAFSRMVADPEYQQVTHLRTEALTEALLQPTTLW